MEGGCHLYFFILKEMVDEMKLLEELENEKRSGAYTRQLDEIADGLVGRDTHRFEDKE